jgi:hypothetical protein
VTASTSGLAFLVLWSAPSSTSLIWRRVDSDFNLSKPKERFPASVASYQDYDHIATGAPISAHLGLMWLRMEKYTEGSSRY